ncbi:MAG: hypothetical protein ACE5FF_05705 [Saprospiraceae bacterium]
MKTKILFLAIVLFAACRKDNSGGENSTLNYARLEASVSLCDQQARPFCDPYTDSLEAVQGARVFLFEHKIFQEDGEPFVFDGTTNGQGQLTFSTLEKKEYWVTVQLPPPDGRQQKEYVKTPLHTTTYLPVVFPNE